MDLAIQCFYNIIIGIKNYVYFLNYKVFCNEIIQFCLLNDLLENLIKFIGYDFDIENNKNSKTNNFSVNVDIIKTFLKIFDKKWWFKTSNTDSLFNELFNLLASFFPSQINKDNIGILKRKLMKENKYFYKFFSENILSLLIYNILNISSSSTI